jgi:hypothetical protein
MMTATPWNQSEHLCDCCGNRSRTFWGEVSEPDRTLAVYYVHYTRGSAQHAPLIDVIVGPWGDGARAEDRVLVTLAYRPGPGGGIMVADAAGRPSDNGELCGRALSRDEVVGTALAKELRLR